MTFEKKLMQANLSEIFSDLDAQESHVGKRLVATIKGSKRVLTPPFPRQIQVETSNICNHGCDFCAYKLMKRAKSQMDPVLFKRLVLEAYNCGAREIGLFAGAEPLTCKNLVEFIAYCKQIGYEYTYISTNGSAPNKEKFKQALDAGLDSIKFSVNGGNRAMYEQVHRNDHFDRVIDNIRFVNFYRNKVPQKVFLGISFVAMDISRHTFIELKELIGDSVDEILYYEASNQSGQMPELPLPPYHDCHLPFSKAHISREGYLKACCNDYDNLLALTDLNKIPLHEAWHSDKFQELRRKHIEDKLTGTLCANCIRGCSLEPAPLNEELGGK